MAAGRIEIKGQAELERAFLELRKEVFLELKAEIAAIGEKVRSEAQSLAGSEIENVGPRWGQMRLVVKAKGVYVQPKSRNRGGPKRPNMAGLLMDRAMQPALDSKQEEAVRAFSAVCDVSAARNGFF